MKIWQSYSGEHSANLKIIGKFESVSDAQTAKDLIDQLTEIDPKLDSSGKHTKEALDFCGKHRFEDLNSTDLEQLNCVYDIEVVGQDVVINTEETDVQAFLKMLINRKAKIEVYSLHDYP